MDIKRLSILVACLLCLYFLLQTLIKFLYKVWWNPIRVRKIFISQGIKGPPYKFLFGNTMEIWKMMQESMTKKLEFSHEISPVILPHIHKWTNIYGKNFLYWYGLKPQLVVTEFELVKEILNNRSGFFIKPEFDEDYKKLLGNGIFVAEGKRWATLRKRANHSFHADSLKGMVPGTIDGVSMMLERWKDHEGKEIDVHEEFRVMTSDVISRTVFGSSYLEGKNIFEMLNKLVSIATANTYKTRLPGLRKFFPNQDDIEGKKLEEEIQKSIIQIIRSKEEKLKVLKKSDSHRCDFLELLIEANQETDKDKQISVQDMVDECKIIFLGGHETSTSLLAWTCMLLASDTEWQDKARKEVVDLFGQKDSIIDYNSISRLKTMTHIINESLRLYPPTVNIMRSVAKEAKLGDLILPPKIELVISSLAIHHDPEIWGDDVHLFKPDRFAEGVVKATNGSNAFLPFGLGPRSCVGMNFAMIEAKIALAMILQRYHFTLSPTYVHSPVFSVAIRPQYGVQLMLHAL